MNLNGYELSGSIEVTAGTLYVTDTSENGGGLLFNPSGTAVAVTGGALDIANARITGTDSVINITGGELNITNAQITGKDSAINVYNGTVNIDKDTVISAEGNAVNLITPYSKNNEEDNSVDINSMDSNSMELTVSGGSITSTEGAAVREYLDTSESQDGEEIIWHTNISNITIKDGTFSGKEKALDFSDSLVKEESVLNIIGGTFSSDIKEYLSSAYTTNKTEDGQYIISERENPVKEDLKYNLEDVTYDGKTHPVKVSSEKALGAIKVLYNGKEEMPVNAGTYEVSVEIAESNNYYSGQFDLGSFQITKAETSVNLTVALTNEREHVEENTIGYFGDEVTMTASVDGVEGETLEGSVAFYDGETELKTVPLENNSAQFKTSELTAQTHQITAKYIPAEEANYKGSVSEKVAANIAEVKETGIEVTTQPAKTTYTDSETFNPEGMIVTAHYNNGSTKEVEDYTVDTTTKLTVDTTEIQITHADNYTASVPVTVGHDTNYRYEKNEARNTLTKKCGGCDETFGTMSIAAPESMELDRENGNPAVLTVTGDISASEVSITYASLTGADISPLAPTKAGAYTATATYNNQTVTVMFTLIISVTGVTANEVYALKVGDSANLSKKIAPEDATNQDVIWKSDNENIVTVDENGKITAVAEGEANITVTTKDQNKTATCKIYVMPQNAKFGKCGDNAWWKFNNGVFTVWGNGAVTDTSGFSAYKTKTTSVVVEKGITEVGGFYGFTALENIEIMDGVEKIKESAFKSCKNLKQIELPESITKIGQDAFRDCTGVSYIKIGSPKCEYASGFGVFSGMGSSEGVTVEFGEKVTEIPRLMLGAQVKTVKFDGKVKKIGNYAFYGWSNLGEIELPESVEEIGNGAFVGCAKLSSITLGSNITTIGYNAFYGLTNLTTVTLPSKLKDIAGNAFANCKNLKEYIVSDENKDLSAKDGVLYGKDETELISYPAGKDDQTEFDMLSMNVDTIREGAFDGNTALKSVKIGDDVQTIGEEAFANVSDALTLHVYKNSYADEYAKENEVPVEYLSEEVEEGTPVFRGASLSLAGTILINYYIEFPEDVKDGRVEFDLVDDSGKTKSKVTATLKDASKETITSGGKQYEYYKYSVSLTAKQMADKVLAKAYATTADGKEVATRKFYYSVEKYVSNKMKNTATKDSLKNVLASMVNYGAAAQNYFAYNTQHLADKLLYDTTIVTDENKKKLDSTLEGYQKTKEQMQQYIRTITEVENPKTRIAGIALDLKSTVSIRVIVPKDITSADNKIAYTVGDGTAVKYLKLQNYDATYYYADITGIVAKNLDDMYHIYVCDASGNQISNIVNYGVMSYAIQKWESENEDLVNLVKKLQVYNVAAQKYFESK